MNMALTRQDLKAIDGILDRKFDLKLAPIHQEIQELKNDIAVLREQIQELTITLDKFVKMMTDYNEEFALLKAEVDQIKSVLNEKFGIKIAIQK